MVNQFLLNPELSFSSKSHTFFFHKKSFARTRYKTEVKDNSQIAYSILPRTLYNHVFFLSIFVNGIKKLKWLLKINCDFISTDKRNTIPSDVVAWCLGSSAQCTFFFRPLMLTTTRKIQNIQNTTCRRQEGKLSKARYHSWEDVSCSWVYVLKWIIKTAHFNAISCFQSAQIFIYWHNCKINSNGRSSWILFLHL